MTVEEWVRLVYSLRYEAAEPVGRPAVVWGGGVDHDMEMTRLLLEAGWPMDVRGGDIDGSALNGAVFRGDAELTAFLMAHGGGLRVPHGVWR